MTSSALEPVEQPLRPSSLPSSLIVSSKDSALRLPASSMVFTVTVASMGSWSSLAPSIHTRVIEPSKGRTGSDGRVNGKEPVSKAKTKPRLSGALRSSSALRRRVTQPRSSQELLTWEPKPARVGPTPRLMSSSSKLGRLGATSSAIVSSIRCSSYSTKSTTVRESSHR